MRDRWNMNNELLSLYKADKHERLNQPKVNTPEYKAMRGRDLERRERVMEIFAANELHTAEDHYHAAWIMNHGDTPDDARNAHMLALRSSEFGYRAARWLAAATYDRWQMYQGKPQTTDEERAAWDVPPLAEQLRNAEEASRHQIPMSESELREFEANAPEWLKEALERWRAEADDQENDH